MPYSYFHNSERGKKGAGKDEVGSELGCVVILRLWGNAKHTRYPASLFKTQQQQQRSSKCCPRANVFLSLALLFLFGIYSTPGDFSGESNNISLKSEKGSVWVSSGWLGSLLLAGN